MKDSWSINVERFCAKVESLLNLTKRFFAGPLLWPGQFCQLISPAILKSWPENGDSFVHRPVLFKTGTCTINAWTPQDVVLPRETYKYRVFALARPLSYICFLAGIAHVPGGLCKAHFLGDNCTVISWNSSFLCQREKERRKGGLELAHSGRGTSVLLKFLARWLPYFYAAVSRGENLPCKSINFPVTNRHFRFPRAMPRVDDGATFTSLSHGVSNS